MSAPGHALRFAFVTEAVPNPGTVGSDVVSWAILQYARSRGHTVTCYCLVNQWAAEHGEAIQSHVQALSSEGLHVELLKIPVANGAAGSTHDGRSIGRWRNRLQQFHRARRVSVNALYPSAALAPALRERLMRERPDAILAFDTGTVVALRELTVAPRFAIPGDPPHLVKWYRQRSIEPRPDPIRATAIQALNAIEGRRIARELLQVLRGYESVGFFGAQHAAWVEANHIRCLSLRPPVMDGAGPDWQARREACPPRKTPKIVMLGNLGTASLTGMRALVEETLPALERALGPEGFELHLIGRGTLPPDLQERLARPAVRLRGYVEDAASEFLSCDVFLVPTPYPVGVRTRIAEAFSFGCCVVTHPASRSGIPELLDQDNVLLAAEGRGWAQAILRVVKDSTLRTRIGQRARMTYEQCFIPHVAAGQIVDELERLAHDVVQVR